MMNSSNGIKDRLMQFISYLKISTSIFQESIGASNGFVANISKGIGPEKLKAIETLYPELNLEWLRFGNGEMVVNTIEKRPSNECKGRVFDVLMLSGLNVEDFFRSIGSVFMRQKTHSGRSRNVGTIIGRSILFTSNTCEDEEFKKLFYEPILSNWPQISENWLLYGDGEMLKTGIEKPKNPSWARIYTVWLHSELSFSNFSYQIGCMPPILIRYFMGIDTRRSPESYYSKILEKWPSINPQWLNTGEGNMMKVDPLFTPDSDQMDAIENGVDILEFSSLYTDEEKIDFSYRLFDFVLKNSEDYSEMAVTLAKIGVSLKKSVTEKVKILNAENDTLKQEILYLRKEKKQLSEQLHQ